MAVQTSGPATVNSLSFRSPIVIRCSLFVYIFTMLCLKAEFSLIQESINCSKYHWAWQIGSAIVNNLSLFSPLLSLAAVYLFTFSQCYVWRLNFSLIQESINCFKYLIQKNLAYLGSLIHTLGLTFSLYPSE